MLFVFRGMAQRGGNAVSLITSPRRKNRGGYLYSALCLLLLFHGARNEDPEALLTPLKRRHLTLQESLAQGNIREWSTGGKGTVVAFLGSSDAVWLFLGLTGGLAIFLLFASTLSIFSAVQERKLLKIQRLEVPHATTFLKTVGSTQKVTGTSPSEAGGSEEEDSSWGHRPSDEKPLLYSAGDYEAILQPPQIPRRPGLSVRWAEFERDDDLLEELSNDSSATALLNRCGELLRHAHEVKGEEPDRKTAEQQRQSRQDELVSLLLKTLPEKTTSIPERNSTGPQEGTGALDSQGAKPFTAEVQRHHPLEASSQHCKSTTSPVSPRNPPINSETTEQHGRTVEPDAATKTPMMKDKSAQNTSYPQDIEAGTLLSVLRRKNRKVQASTSEKKPKFADTRDRANQYPPRRLRSAYPKVDDPWTGFLTMARSGLFDEGTEDQDTQSTSTSTYSTTAVSDPASSSCTYQTSKEMPSNRTMISVTTSTDTRPHQDQLRTSIGRISR